MDNLMIIVISTLQGAIYNNERIRDVHKRNKDKKNVDYLNARIDKYKEAIEILKKSTMSDKLSLNIDDISICTCGTEEYSEKKIRSDGWYCKKCNKRY